MLGLNITRILSRVRIGIHHWEVIHNFLRIVFNHPSFGPASLAFALGSVAKSKYRNHQYHYNRCDQQRVKRSQFNPSFFSTPALAILFIYLFQFLHFDVRLKYCWNNGFIQQHLCFNLQVVLRKIEFVTRWAWSKLPLDYQV